MDEKKIIQHVLGELDSVESKDVEKVLEADLEARICHSEIKAVVEALQATSTPSEGLDDAQKQDLLRLCRENIRSSATSVQPCVNGEKESRPWLRDILRYGVPLAAAASICAAFLIFQNLETPAPRTTFPTFTASNSASQGANPVLPAFFAESSSSQKVHRSKTPLSRDSETSLMPSIYTSVESEGLVTWPQPAAEHNREAYNVIQENEFRPVSTSPLSTFSIDVDTASYSNVRRYLNADQLPPDGSVRSEELLNYFRYEYPTPTNEETFSINVESAPAPWDPDRLLVKIGLRGKDLPLSDRPSSNLVFLVDTSGSMEDSDKLPLLQKTLKESLSQLRPEDRVSIVSYAGSSGVVLPPTSGKNREAIVAAIDNLSASGSTAGSAGIQKAYELASGEAFIKGGNNRVILCTDGDFNVGMTSQAALESLIEQKRDTGVFLTVLGFGRGNLQDATMELLANRGNGNYAYIDSMQEARKVLGTELGSTLFTIAKDVKIQVEFNPAKVAGYRLIGYENRLLSPEDFNNDKKDAGEIGAGHTVTAMYEVIPLGQEIPGSPSTDPLKYQSAPAPSPSSDILTVKVRYKNPSEYVSRVAQRVLKSEEISARPSEDFNFASAVAAFSMKLRKSPQVSIMSWDDIKKLAKSSLGSDESSHRAEFLTLVEKAKQISATQSDANSSETENREMSPGLRDGLLRSDEF